MPQIYAHIPPKEGGGGKTNLYALLLFSGICCAVIIARLQPDQISYRKSVIKQIGEYGHK